MRVALDFKVVSSEAALRGMGRYTQQQLREVLRLDPGIEVFLLMHGAVEPANMLFDWNSLPNVHMVPVSVDGHDLAWDRPLDVNKVLQYSHRLQYLLKRHEIDVFHSAVPFMNPYYSCISVCPVVATYYDAIPLVFASEYFALPWGTPEVRQSYLNALNNVAAADQVIAISRSAAADLRQYAGVPERRIRLAHPAIEDVFRPLSREAVGNLIGEAGGESGGVDWSSLPPKFVLSVTGIHQLKNESVLIESYLDAARDLAPEWGLVVILPSALAKRDFHDRFGTDPRIRTLADISQNELALLYNMAEIVVQPSMYDGFSYPVAEAMSCGAAVIASNASSIPEIAGHAAILVAPTDVKAMAAGIVRLASDDALRLALQRKALARSAHFAKPEELGRATLAAYREAHRQRRPDSATSVPARSGPPRVAIWSSMPPRDCGVADYTNELANELGRTHNVDVYVDGQYSPRIPSAARVRFRHPDDYAVDGQPGLTIFQLGARKGYQDFMYPYLRRHGGTMVLHDVSMGLGFFLIARSDGTLNRFEDEMVSVEGPEALKAYDQLGVSLGSAFQEQLVHLFEKHKMLRWIINKADRVVVHTAPLRDMLLAEYPEANAEIVRMGVADWIPSFRHLPLPALRQALGLTGDGICIGCYGILDRTKRNDVMIEAFRELSAAHPGSILLLVGRCLDLAYQQELEARIQASGLSGRVLQFDYVPPESFQTLLALADVVVNLRAPSRMGLSAVLVRALAAAKPVIISPLLEWATFPEEVCLRLGSGDAEAPHLARLLLDLAASPALRQRYGLAARQWYLENGTLSAMAADYLRAGSRPADNVGAAAADSCTPAAAG